MKKIIAGLVCGAMLLALPALVMAAPQNKGEVIVYNWSEYIPPDVIQDFTRETGIKVIYSTFESNEAMYAKVKLMGGQGYDIVVPSNYYLELMRQEKMLSEIDHDKIPNLKNLDPKFLNAPYDPGSQYSIPYMWGITGLAYNSKFVESGELLRWADLTNPKFKGNIILSDDLRDTFSIGLKATGSSANSTHQAEIEKAFAWLCKLKPSVRVFDVTATKQALISEEVWVGPIWNGDFLVAQQENEDLRFVFPEEGAFLWVDSFVILNGAPNKENAHIFINYMLRPEVAKRCIEEFMYSSPNLAGLNLLDEELRNNPVLVPNEDVMSNAEWQGSVGSFLKIYEKYWEMLKTGECGRS